MVLYVYSVFVYFIFTSSGEKYLRNQETPQILFIFFFFLEKNIYLSIYLPFYFRHLTTLSKFKLLTKINKITKLTPLTRLNMCEYVLYVFYLLIKFWKW